MNWILVVLQITATGTIHPYSKYGWTTVGEFASEKACVAASVKMAQASEGTPGIKNFQCLAKGEYK